MTNNPQLPVGEAPPHPQTRPRVAPPSGSCDAHLHFIAADPNFPLWTGRVEDPASGDFDEWMVRLEAHLEALGMDRVVVVHSILFGDDNAITLAAVQKLGLKRARAICLVADDVDNASLDAMANAGAAGVRLNYVHGGVLSWAGAQAMAPRLAERDMHIQMLANAAEHLEEIAGDIAALPVPVVFDHIGWPDLARGVEEPGFAKLLRLVADGHAYVKLSGLYRFCDEPYAAADEAVASLIAANADNCLWGSDWPHIMRADAPMPSGGAMLDALMRVASSEQLERILVTNPRRIYRF